MGRGPCRGVEITISTGKMPRVRVLSTTAVPIIITSWKRRLPRAHGRVAHPQL